MKKEYKNRFQKSNVFPRDFVPESREEYICQQIALKLGEQDMRYMLASLYRLKGNTYPLELAFAQVNDAMRLGKAQNPRRLFNFLVSEALGKKAQSTI